MYSRKKAFISACLGLFIVGNVFISFGTLSMYLKSKFFLDELSMGTVAGVLSFGTLIGSIVFGPIVDRYGYKTLTIVSTFIILAGFELIVFGDTLFLLYVAFLLSGIGGGIINGSTTALVADISSEDKGANLSLLHAFFGIGYLTMPIVSGFLINYTSFERIFFYFGILILLSVFYYLRVVFPTPKQPHGLPWKKAFHLLKEFPLLFFSMILFFQGGIENIVNNWTVRYVQNKYVSDMSNLIYLLTFYAVGIVVIRLLLSFFLKRSNSIYILLLSLFVSLCGILVLWLSSSYGLFMLGILLIGVGFSSIFPIMLGFISEKYSEYSGTALSITFLFALLGGVVFSIFMGFISKYFGINQYPVIISSGIVIIIIATTGISKLNILKKDA